MGLINHFRKVAFKSKVQVCLASILLADDTDSMTVARKVSVELCMLNDPLLEAAWARGLTEPKQVATVIYLDFHGFDPDAPETIDGEFLPC